MTRPSVFIGSSSEGHRVAHEFQVALEHEVECEAVSWDQGIFGASEYPMEALAREATTKDFAVLVMTPDDIIESRGDAGPGPRDNVLLELGLFIGALGRERVFILCPAASRLKLPSDLNGITRLRDYREDRSDGNLRAALNAAAVDARHAIENQGPRTASAQTAPTQGGAAKSNEELALADDLERIRRNAIAQGWQVRAADTALRLRSPKGTRFSCPLDADPRVARTQLREFAKELRAAGLRVSSRVRTRPAPRS